jgi:sec-independent protein translocase protein TatA
MIGKVGPTELILVLLIVLIIFGVGKLPEIGGAFGRCIKNFKTAAHEPPEIGVTPNPERTPDDAKS